MQNYSSHVRVYLMQNDYKHGINVAHISKKMWKIALDSRSVCRFGVVYGIQRAVWHTRWK